ncbi:4-diphosphocytidyl-2-C-methyl-D-erythritol kinase [Planctomycetes bacterium Poly30]|uniref:4-diphosphocytidyl-2-C-methyl-D-erythritol kinase n=1 Tax=Saltatorellus ferox TaxID=2528018 RepID=A0A518EWV0_9BACT|nr:4-diphosphocytidyl-2-C-methyl-D-erythritol kinase [Planctomycetes bacterium Poly30]
MTEGRISVAAGAKVNPRLVIHGRRADGFHELTTLMLGLDLVDEVTVELVAGTPRAGERAPITVTSRGPFASPDISTDETNLAARGARAALQALGREDVALLIELEKRIPSRAGLGGGSADAAAAALATLQLLQPDRGVAVDAAVTESLGRIGADCAFFFAARHHGAALSSGRGEAVEPIAADPPWHVALLTPAIDCATPAVYGALGLEPKSAAELRAAAEPRGAEVRPADLFSATASPARALLLNDLEAAAIRAFPALGEWRALFEGVGHGHFLLAGSGSSFFGLFDEAVEAASALEALRGAAAERSLAFRHASVHRPAGEHLLRVLHSPDRP